MSWSVYATGKSDVVAKKVAADFAAIKVSGPEIEAVNAAALMVAAGLAAQVPAAAVKLEAFGSQSATTLANGPSSYTNSITIKIEPIPNFLG